MCDEKVKEEKGVLEVTAEEFLTSLNYEMWTCGECAFLKIREPGNPVTDGDPFDGLCILRGPTADASHGGAVWPGVQLHETCGESVPSHKTINTKADELKSGATESTCVGACGSVDSGAGVVDPDEKPPPEAA